MKYYPNKDSNFIDYIEVPEDGSSALVVKAKDIPGFTKLEGIFRYISNETGKQIEINANFGKLETQLIFAENSNYLTFFRVLISNDFMTKEFSQRLYNNIQSSRQSLGNSFQSPLGNSSSISPQKNIELVSQSNLPDLKL